MLAKADPERVTWPPKTSSVEPTIVTVAPALAQSCGLQRNLKPGNHRSLGSDSRALTGQHCHFTCPLTGFGASGGYLFLQLELEVTQAVPQGQSRASGQGLLWPRPHLPATECCPEPKTRPTPQQRGSSPQRRRCDHQRPHCCGHLWAQARPPPPASHKKTLLPSVQRSSARQLSTSCEAHQRKLPATCLTATHAAGSFSLGAALHRYAARS